MSHQYVLQLKLSIKLLHIKPEFIIMTSDKIPEISPLRL